MFIDPLKFSASLCFVVSTERPIFRQKKSSQSDRHRGRVRSTFRKACISKLAGVSGAIQCNDCFENCCLRCRAKLQEFIRDGGGQGNLDGIVDRGSCPPFFTYPIFPQPWRSVVVIKYEHWTFCTPGIWWWFSLPKAHLFAVCYIVLAQKFQARK